MKKIAILGITGSVGLSTCAVVREHCNDFQIVLASANQNVIDALALSEEFSIPTLVIINQKNVQAKNFNTNLYFGAENLKKLLQSIECDIVVNAISGSAGLPYSIITLERGLTLALANKESLVMAGHLMTAISTNKNVSIIPIDSEHSAILQAIGTTPKEEIKRIILTASGGPFRTLPFTEFNSITVENSLKHPTWNMGAKITIDSATMMNKGLEVMEAHWLFQQDYEKITAVIHPQSIIHSLVEFIDGSLMAQLSFPTMKLPILHALTYPHHQKSNLCETDLLSLPALTFESIPKQKYPLFYTAIEAGKIGGLFPTILNAANEAAISLYFTKKIAYRDIHKLVELALQSAENIENPDLDTILAANDETYQKVISESLTKFM
jgi:1-deoxy-D-xylulose-5-phosphate reductoisomerase